MTIPTSRSVRPSPVPRPSPRNRSRPRSQRPSAHQRFGTCRFDAHCTLRIPSQHPITPRTTLRVRAFRSSACIPRASSVAAQNRPTSGGDPQSTSHLLGCANWPLCFENALGNTAHIHVRCAVRPTRERPKPSTRYSRRHPGGQRDGGERRSADRCGLAQLLRIGTDFHRLASLLVDEKPITQRIRQLNDHQVAAVIPARWVIRADRDRHEQLFLRCRHPIVISVAGADLEYERAVTTEFSIDDFGISSSATTEHHCACSHHRSKSNGRATQDHPDKIARLPSSATAKASAERQFGSRP